MATFTVQVKVSDAELILKILQKFEAKIIENPSKKNITADIEAGLREIKDIQLGKIKPLSLKDI